MVSIAENNKINCIQMLWWNETGATFGGQLYFCIVSASFLPSAATNKLIKLLLILSYLIELRLCMVEWQMSARQKFARCAIIRFVSTLYQSDNGFHFTYTFNTCWRDKAARDFDIARILNNVYLRLHRVHGENLIWPHTTGSSTHYVSHNSPSGN